MDCFGEVRGDLDWWLMSAIAVKMRPVRSSSISEIFVISAVVSASVKAATDGVDTHDGGPSESE